jgi:hypothetical protein
MYKLQETPKTLIRYFQVFCKLYMMYSILPVRSVAITMWKFFLRVPHIPPNLRLLNKQWWWKSVVMIVWVGGANLGRRPAVFFLFSAPRKRGNTCPCAKCMIFECFHNITPCSKAVRMGILHEKSKRRRSVHGLVKFRAVIPVLYTLSFLLRVHTSSSFPQSIVAALSRVIKPARTFSSS